MKAGLEIHQQLATAKLFCSCPCALRDDEPDGRVTRRLRAVSGESGEIDQAALQEMQRERTFLYEFYDRTTCLVELDDEPPHELNRDALKVALQLALTLKMKIVDRIQVMRKIVIDGSNTSGFQRTALIARDGVLVTKSGDVPIETLCLEEESARIMGEGDHTVRYRLDRLGIPLVEIATAPTLHSPEQVRDVAQAIGMLLRSTGKVRRGIGTIRQDINISIPQGDRVEVKGAQDLRLIPTIVENEVARQERLADLQERIDKLTIGHPKDLTPLLKRSASKIVQKSLGIALGIRAEQAKGIFGTILQPDKRFGTELSDYAKQRSGIGGLMHSDELPAYGITAEEVASIRSALACHEHDGFILIVGEKDRATRAADAVHERLKMHGVQREVRKANPDGTTSYLRPIASSDRMYPETDVPPVVPVMTGITVPESLEERSQRYSKTYGLNIEIAGQVVAEDFPLEDLHAQYPSLKPQLIIDLLLLAPKDIRRRFGIEIDPLVYVDKIFPFLQEGRLTREAALEILAAFARNESPDIATYFRLSKEELERELKLIVSQNKALPANALIGKAMATLRGRADGKEIVEILNGIKAGAK